MTKTISRRKFLSATAGAVAVAGLTSPAVRANGKAAVNERMRLGFIGCGRRGRQLIPVFRKFNDVDIPVICDVNGKSMDEAYELSGRKPERERDYRRILDRKDIDAVVIATNEHWYGLPFIQACQATKHIFVEKPLSHTVVEGRAMVRAAQKAGVITMMGTQQRGQEHYVPAVEIVRSVPIWPARRVRANW